MSYESEAADFYKENPSGFVVKDSGKREDYESGMRRDTEEGKVDYTLVYDGPLVDRYAAHLTKGAEKYGRRNWQLACSQEEYERFKRSAARHFRQWLRGDTDEDHMAAVVFNLNAAEYVKERIREKNFGPGTVNTPRRMSEQITDALLPIYPGGGT